MNKDNSVHEDIYVLDDSCITAIHSSSDEGMHAATFQCNISWGDGSNGKAYIKFFPNDKINGPINEVTGYLMAKGCNLPVPLKLALVKLPEEFYIKNGVLSLAIAVSEVPGKTYKTLLTESELQVPEILDFIFEWVHAENMLAFDDWAANGDRNLGNLVMYSSDDISLIDHSDMPIRLTWEVSDLEPDVQIDSKLAKSYSYNLKATEVERGKLENFASAHLGIFESIQDKLKYWWAFTINELSSEFESEQKIKSLDYFFNSRATKSVERIRDNSSLLKVI